MCEFTDTRSPIRKDCHVLRDMLGECTTLSRFTVCSFFIPAKWNIPTDIAIATPSHVATPPRVATSVLAYADSGSAGRTSAAPRISAHAKAQTATPTFMPHIIPYFTAQRSPSPAMPCATNRQLSFTSSVVFIVAPLSFVMLLHHFYSPIGCVPLHPIIQNTPHRD